MWLKSRSGKQRPLPTKVVIPKDAKEAVGQPCTHPSAFVRYTERVMDKQKKTQVLVSDCLLDANSVRIKKLKLGEIMSAPQPRHLCNLGNRSLS